MKNAGVLSILFVLVLLTVAVIGEAQQPKKVHRIGYLVGGDVAPERFEAIRLALRELGYIEGQNIAIKYRYAEGKRDRSVRSRAKIWSSHSTSPRNLMSGGRPLAISTLSNFEQHLSCVSPYKNTYGRTR
jgi:hypothetical protein